MKGIIRLLILTLCYTATSGFGQNAPVSIAGSVVSLNETAIVPVYALNFINISSCDLKISYDTTVAIATGVTIGPGLGGMISTNLTVPGMVNFGWFTSGGINLPDSSVIFNIHFNKKGHGLSTVHWIDSGYSCEYNDGSFQPLNDLPTSDYYHDGFLAFQSPDAPVTSAPALSVVPGTEVNIPISVSNFLLIGSISLNLQYDADVLSFNSFNNDAGFPGLEIDGSEPGNLLVSGLVPEGDTAVTLIDTAVLFTLSFDYMGGATSLNWIDNGISCQYRGSLPVYPVLNDAPQGTYYLYGMITESSLPAGAGVIAGPDQLCAASPSVNYSIEEINFATAYVWNVPDGAQILSGQNTNAIVVDFGINTLTGQISVYGTNTYGNGIPSSLQVTVSEQPAAAGQVSGTFEVCLGEGQYSYSVDVIPAATSYNWLIPDGAVITSGMNTNIIQVHYGNNAASGNILVYGSNGCGSGGTSTPQWVSVNIPPQILMEPVSPPAVHADSGSAAFSVFASGTELNYQWQEFIGSWNDLTESDLYVGVNSDTLYIVNPTIIMNGNYYRCQITGMCNHLVTTNGEAMLTVLTPIGIQTQGDLTVIFTCSNPFADFILLSIDFPQSGKLTINLINLVGQPVMKELEYSINPGMHSIPIHTPGLEPGLYLLQLKLKTDNNLLTSTLKLLCGHKSK